MPSLKKQWVLTQNAFDQLLSRLGADREQAAERYEELRQMLVTFFEFRDAPHPEEQADETINRVARRISEGQQINENSIDAYFHSVARNVWREHLARPQRVVASLDELPPGADPAGNPDETRARSAERNEMERRFACLETCLQALPREHRELITNYYQGAGETKINSRKLLAEALGIPLNALRIRAFRLRDKIEACVGECLTRSSDQ